MRRILPLEEGSRIHVPDSWVDPLDLGALFGRSAPVEVEIGCGNGSFALEWAARHPERNLLGIERMLGRIRKADRKVAALGLDNLRLMRIEASYLVAYLLPPASIEVFHIYFPDPWPKRRHSRHRLVVPGFLTGMARALVPGGRVQLRTDDAPYFDEIRRTFAADPGFEPLDHADESAGILTRFEQRFLAEGLPIHRAQYRRSRTPAP